MVTAGFANPVEAVAMMMAATHAPTAGATALMLPTLTNPRMSSTSTKVATNSATGIPTSVAHRLGQRVCGFAKGEVRQSHPHDSADDLGDGIQAGGRDVEGPGRYEADGHCRIEVRTRHRTQEGDECRQPGTNGHTVCEELEYAVGAEALDHDPASHDQVQQHGRAETFRSEGPRAIDHHGASTSKRSTRSVMSANAVTKASAVPTDTGSGTDQCRWGSVNGMRVLRCPVAHRDDDVVGAHHVAITRGRGCGEVDAEVRCHGNGHRVHGVGRVGSCALDRLSGAVLPQRGGELRPCRIGGADEQGRGVDGQRSVGDEASDARVEYDVSPASVTFRCPTVDDARILEHVEVMGQEIARHVHQRGDVAHGEVTHGERVGYLESLGIAEGSVHPGAMCEVHERAVY